MLIGVIAEALLLPSTTSVQGEATTAADIADALVAYSVAVIEAATAASVQDAATVAVITGAVDEAASAASTQDATVIGAVAARSAMLPGVFVNTGTSREANVAGIMVNV